MEVIARVIEMEAFQPKCNVSNKVEMESSICVCTGGVDWQLAFFPTILHLLSF